VGHFASAEAQAGFHLVAFRKEAQHVVALGHVIVLVNVDAELNFLQDDLLLVLLRRALLLFLFIQVLPVVHDAADGRNGVRRDLYQIKILFAGLSRRIHRRHDAELLAVRADHAHFACADALIHANKPFIYASLLRPLMPAHPFRKERGTYGAPQSRRANGNPEYSPSKMLAGIAVKPAGERLENYSMRKRNG
jgi:hypothetical protein